MKTKYIRSIYDDMIEEIVSTGYEKDVCIELEVSMVIVDGYTQVLMHQVDPGAGNIYRYISTKDNDISIYEFKIIDKLFKKWNDEYTCGSNKTNKV